jgi:hypothetical protein
VSSIERAGYQQPVEPRWVPAALPDDQCDLCGKPSIGYWLSLDKTGRRILDARCGAHDDEGPKP